MESVAEQQHHYMGVAEVQVVEQQQLTICALHDRYVHGKLLIEDMEQAELNYGIQSWHVACYE